MRESETKDGKTKDRTERVIEMNKTSEEEQDKKRSIDGMASCPSIRDPTQFPEAQFMEEHG